MERDRGRRQAINQQRQSDQALDYQAGRAAKEITEGRQDHPDPCHHHHSEQQVGDEDRGDVRDNLRRCLVLCDREQPKDDDDGGRIDAVEHGEEEDTGIRHDSRRSCRTFWDPYPVFHSGARCRPGSTGDAVAWLGTWSNQPSIPRT